MALVIAHAELVSDQTSDPRTAPQRRREAVRLGAFQQQRLEAFELRGVQQRLTAGAAGLAQPGFAVTPVSSQPLADALPRDLQSPRCLGLTTALLDQPDRFETALLQGLEIPPYAFCISHTYKDVRTPKRCHFVLRDSISTTQYKRPEDLLRDADTAMYRQKASQNGYDEIVNVQRQVRASSQLQLEADLEHGLRDKQFVVHYQPIVALPSGEITGCEALVRWEHPTRGLLMPAEFIPAAESTGLILPIGEFVLRSACAQNRAWRQAGLPSLNMSVNVSARQLYRQQFADTVSEILAETGSPPDSIELELTESLLMEHPEKAAEMLTKLKNLGLRIAVDDFGTGYCSLSYLLRFPLHTLKIDRTFVDGPRGTTREAITLSRL